MGNPDSDDFNERMRYWDHKMAQSFTLDSKLTVAGIIALGLLAIAIFLHG